MSDKINEMIARFVASLPPSTGMQHNGYTHNQPAAHRCACGRGHDGPVVVTVPRCHDCGTDKLPPGDLFCPQCVRAGVRRGEQALREAGALAWQYGISHTMPMNEHPYYKTLIK